MGESGISLAVRCSYFSSAPAAGVQRRGKFFDSLPGKIPELGEARTHKATPMKISTWTERVFSFGSSS
jgi:hypothetical protein